MHARASLLTLVTLLVASAAQPLAARQDATGSQPDTVRFVLDRIAVTATRDARLVRAIPRPVSVVDQTEIDRLQPNNVADLFRTLPGLEVTGVGANQTRPSIRGQRGQRLLLLQDGLRMNNTRRQQDFGEIPALVDIDAVERVEVVRGPASVLYGSDAIGGVINIITTTPPTEGIRGSGSFRYGEAGQQTRFSGRFAGRAGDLSWQLGASTREMSDYEAPAGEFGQITLARDSRVLDTGVEDRSVDLRLGWDLGPAAHVFGQFETYEADDAGFGRVAPADYAPGAAEVAIDYPEQTFRKFTGGLRFDELGWGLADRLEVLGYTQNNDRVLELSLFTSFGIPNLPQAGLQFDTRGDTEVSTWGFRAEAQKLLGERVLVTYGVDGFNDRAEGTDQAVTTVFGFGPPQTSVSNRPQIPTAEFFSAGAFVQADLDLTDRLDLVGGVRYQNTRAETFQTDGLPDQDPVEESDDVAVAAVNAIYDLTDSFSLVGAVGSAFRTPNLVERFFDGPTPEGSGYQARNLDLQAEKSLNVDLGARFVNDRISLEGFWFRNRIEDGIAVAPILDGQGQPIEIQGLPAFSNVNVDELVFTGYELAAEVRLPSGFRAEGTWSELDSEDANDPETPVGDSYSSVFTSTLGWTSGDGRLFADWRLRHSGERKDVNILENPIGDVLPSFTVQNLRFGVVIGDAAGTRHSWVFGVTNLTDALYAEATNATFFRPEPGRAFTLTYGIGF
jgi:outer membrane receptor protein involved in Fe transport